MPDPTDLDDDENWTGGFYELALQLGPRDDARLASAFLGALEQVLPSVGGYRFEGEAESLGWRLQIDDWLVTIARSVFLVAPFRLGLVGFEVSGMADGNDLEIPEERGMGYLVPNRGELTYHPATV